MSGAAPSDDNPLARTFSSMTVNEDPTKISEALLLALPNELIIQVLSNLPWQDIINCRSVSLFLRRLVDESVNLQYQLALVWAGLEDGNGSETIAERLVDVLAQQQRWRTLQWLKKTYLDVDFSPTGIYEFSGGIFVLGRSGNDGIEDNLQAGGRKPPPTQAFRVVKLPLASDIRGGSPPNWRRTELATGSRLRDLGMDVEQDLVILMELADDTIRLHFRTLSTCQPHPATATPTFEYPCEIPQSYSFIIAVVGPHVGILFIPRIFHSDHLINRLIIYSWTMGYIRAYADAPPGGSWTSFTFLSPFDFIIPNPISGLEVYTFDPTSTVEPPPELKPMVTLHLPERRRNVIPSSSSCRTDPPPRGDLSHLDGIVGIQRPPVMSFRTSREDSIVVFSFTIEDYSSIYHTQVGLTLLVHRRALLSVVSQIRGSLEREVNWEDWGPPITRWLEGSRPVTWAISVHGHRLVAMEEHSSQLTANIYVYDFNPVAIARARFLSVPTDLVTQSTPSVYLEEDKLFKYKVLGNLPYLVAKSEESFACSGAMIDYHRIMLMQDASRGILRRGVLLTM